MPRTAVLIGCGAMAKGWLKAIAARPDLKNRIRILGLVDLDRKAAEDLVAEFGLTGVVIGTNLDNVLTRTKPNFLFDVVPPASRHDVVLTGLKHGCHVLSEKPMAVTLESARSLIEHSTKLGLTHAIVQNRRFNPGVRRIREFIDRGAIGELTGIHGDFFIGAHFGGFREHMQNVLLLDMAIHTFDAARFMSDKQPLSVYCHEMNPKGSWYVHGAAAQAIFELSDDVVFTYRGSWCAEGANTSWEGTWRVIGTDGTLIWDGADKLEAHRVAPRTGLLRGSEPVPVPEVSDARQTQGHASVIGEFIDSIDANRQPETVNTDNIRSLAMVLGAIESARTRRRIKIAV
jgi:predicted dehydrogenase